MIFTLSGRHYATTCYYKYIMALYIRMFLLAIIRWIPLLFTHPTIQLYWWCYTASLTFL